MKLKLSALFLLVMMVGLSGCNGMGMGMGGGPGFHGSAFGPPGHGHQPTGLNVYTNPNFYNDPIFR